MTFTITPAVRAAAVGAAAAALLIGAFALGASRGGASPDGPGRAGATLVSAVRSGRITVTGNGTVTGTPNQLTLTMGVQVNGGSVASALQQANQAVRAGSRPRCGPGRRGGRHPDHGPVHPAQLPAGSQTPSGYGVSESLTATLTRIAAAGSQITAAVHAGGNATTVDGVSLNLTDDSGLLATARDRAVADARVRPAQYAHALGQPLGPGDQRHRPESRIGAGPGVRQRRRRPRPPCRSPRAPSSSASRSRRSTGWADWAWPSGTALCGYRPADGECWRREACPARECTQRQAGGAAPEAVPGSRTQQTL